MLYLLIFLNYIVFAEMEKPPLEARLDDRFNIMELYGLSENEFLTQINQMDRLNRIQSQLFHNPENSVRPPGRKYVGGPKTSIEGAKTILRDELNSKTLRRPDESRVLFEGDLLLTTQQMNVLIEDAEDQLYDSRNQQRYPKKNKRSIIDYFDSKWETSAPIPYSITTEVNRSAVLEGIHIWEAQTCLRFREVRELPRYGLRIISGKGCYSRLGKVQGPQIVSIGPGCEYPLIVAHEIGHALGLIHEQSRPDRDSYIRVNERNIQQYMSGQFHRQSPRSLNDYGVKYDLGSIMHYNADAFSQNGYPTITTIDENYQNTIGQRNSLSFADVKKMNMAYCANVCGLSSLQCKNGGYLDPKDCSRCRCPTGLDGISCEADSSIQQCGETALTAKSEFQSFSMKGAKSCSFLIQADANDTEQRINFRLKEASFTRKTPCQDDFVEIKYGLNMESTGARFCTAYPSVFFSESNKIVVIYSGSFHSKFTLEYSLYQHPSKSTKAAPQTKTTVTPIPVKQINVCRYSECSAKCGACGTRTKICPSSFISREVCNLEPCGGRKCCLPYRKINGSCVKGSAFTSDDLTG